MQSVDSHQQTHIIYRSKWHGAKQQRGTQGGNYNSVYTPRRLMCVVGPKKAFSSLDICMSACSCCVWCFFFQPSFVLYISSTCIACKCRQYSCAHSPLFPCCKTRVDHCKMIVNPCVVVYPKIVKVHNSFKQRVCFSPINCFFFLRVI